MADAKTNNLGAVQGNLTAAYNARKKRDDLYKKGYAVSPDKAKRDEYAALGAEMDSNYNAGFAEIRRLEEEARNQPAFRPVTDADKERFQKIKDIKKQIPLLTRLNQGTLGIFRSREIAPPQERNKNFEEVKSALIENEFQQQAPVSGSFKKAKDILINESINQNEDQNKDQNEDQNEDQVSDTSIEEMSAQRIKESGAETKSPKAQMLYRVMLAGKGPESSEVYETKKAADDALMRAGGKGAVAAINFQNKPKEGTKAKEFYRNYLLGKLGENIPDEEAFSRKQQYIDQLAQTKKISKSESDRIKKIQALRNPQTEEEVMAVAENKGKMADALTAANEAKIAKDKEAKAGFESWASKVRAGRSVEGALNNYDSQLGLLKSAYSQARQSGNPLAAYQIQEYIQEYQSGVPKEMGARKKFAESGELQERTEMFQRKMEEARKQAEKEQQLARSNPDFNQ
jgi:hypothetical protein